MRKQCSKIYGKVAYVTALSLILGSGAYLGIGTGSNDTGNTVIAEAATPATKPAAMPATQAGVIYDFKDFEGNALVNGKIDLHNANNAKFTEGYAVYDGYTTQLKFNNMPVWASDDTADYANWHNFMVTVEDSNESFILRADNWVDASDNNKDGNYNGAFTSIKEGCWEKANWKKVCVGETTVTIKQTGTKTIEVNVQFGDGKNTGKHTLKYTDDIVNDLKVYLGGAFCTLTLKEVRFINNNSSSGGSSSTVTTAPLASGAPAASKTPAASGSPAASQTPAASGSPAASDAPATSESPAASDAPAVSEAPAESQPPVESETPTPSQKPDDDDNNNTNSDKEPEKQTNATAKKQNGITVKADTKANGTATISTVKKTNKTTVTIASTITVNGVKYKVTTIGANAFKNCKKATKISLPSTVKTINKNAFAGAKKLKTIKLTGKKAVTVKKGAFKGLNTKKMTVTVSKKMPKKEFNKMKKNLKNAGFKGKVKKA